MTTDARTSNAQGDGPHCCGLSRYLWGGQQVTLHYDINRQWSDRFLPQIKHIVGSHLLETAPDTLDMTQATDLLMLDARDKRIAARVRRPGYVGRYPFQFTIRSGVPSGAETELAKIVNGKGDWLFYGHSNAGQTAIESWYLIDLNAFRAALIRCGAKGLRWGNKSNPDGTRFTWFDIRSFPPEPPLVVASSD